MQGLFALLRNIDPRRRARLNRLRRANDLRLPTGPNLAALPVLQEVFEARAYADFFPLWTDAVVVDVGAHYGYFSLFAARHTSPNARIFALEPSAANMAQLQQHLVLNAIKKVTPIAAALAVDSGTGQLVSSVSFNHRLADKGETGKPVRLVSLEDLMTEVDLPRIDFLKLDCEGSEYALLDSLSSDTLSRISTISLEFHHGRKATQTGLHLRTLLLQRGFSVPVYAHQPTRMGRNYGRLIATRL